MLTEKRETELMELHREMSKLEHNAHYITSNLSTLQTPEEFQYLYTIEDTTKYSIRTTKGVLMRYFFHLGLNRSCMNTEQMIELFNCTDDSIKSAVISELLMGINSNNIDLSLLIFLLKGNTDLKNTIKQCILNADDKKEDLSNYYSSKRFFNLIKKDDELADEYFSFYLTNELVQTPFFNLLTTELIKKGRVLLDTFFDNVRFTNDEKLINTILNEMKTDNEKTEFLIRICEKQIKKSRILRYDSLRIENILNIAESKKLNQRIFLEYIIYDPISFIMFLDYRFSKNRMYAISDKECLLKFLFKLNDNDLVNFQFSFYKDTIFKFLLESAAVSNLNIIPIIKNSASLAQHYESYEGVSII